MTIITPTSTCNKTRKVKRIKEDGFCVFCFSFVWVLFCGESFFFTFSSSLIFFLITKILVITYKLNTIESFYYKEIDFATFLFFFFFFLS